ncbi:MULTISPECIES: DUF1775 domain-containing protein [unclassified Solwaraspora]|uniref:DUF1775 domain-containing protein n=1 Tax=unclassified Solwaraspora TaxID=2627926 RepID=UPI00248B824B|nr:MULTISPECIES: DUF1775 domain-containing protein [unclassified Solwaraspora]WBB99621.1 DUF1775 domain-containing protein [Solwaraspora sp. WMMA2059]WBC21829.1 DUF1775 domain-containing protein [Solwaraspora sp. WMMA2080]WJK36123.1 DUF1775 domain-containing protein [Solwaraspora sp. WMMA2065]
MDQVPAAAAADVREARLMVNCLRANAVRIGAVLSGSVLAVVLSGSAVAAANIGLEPTQAPRGAGIQLTFELPQERPDAHTAEVRLDLPADLPIAEVYPMSVDDWAPRIINRALPEPLPGLHGGLMTEATESITWQLVSPPADEPAPVLLTVSVGPLPDTDRIEFAVTQTYSDGTVVHWGGPNAPRPGPVLTLGPADPTAAGHGAHHGDPAPAAAQDPPAQAAAAGSDGNAGTGMGLLLAGLAGGAAIGAAVVWWRSRRHRAVPADPTGAGPADDEGELVGSGGTTHWRLTEQ